MILDTLRRCARWLRDRTATTTRNALLRVLAAGPVPRHIAFVMDGNRRYARMHHLRVQQGHSDGFVALRRVRLCPSPFLLPRCVSRPRAID